MNKRKLGTIGEKIAILELEKKGYTIIEKNYLTLYGEIDIICTKGNMIIFVEVKLRKTLQKGYPREAVTFSKQKKIINTANYYISQNEIYNSDFRFDVFEILILNTMSINHIENAFNV